MLFYKNYVHISFLVIYCNGVFILTQNIFGWRRAGFGESDINYNHLDVLSELVDKNQLQSVVDKVFQPHDIEQALEHVESADSIGSTIITFR